MNKNDYDVVIIGGGPAGTVSGIYLSRAGLKTAVVEKKTFPRETLCGEFLSMEVTENLRALNLYDKFLALKPNRINSFQFVTGNKVINSNLSFEGFSLKRSILDHFLLKEAADSGAAVFQPAAVKDVVRNKNYFDVQISSQEDTLSLSSSFVLGAYGRSNILDRKLNRKFSLIKSFNNGIKFHINKKEISGIEDSNIYIFSGDNIYCGINTVSREEATVCFLSKKVRLNESSIIHFEKLFKENDYLATLFNYRIPDLRNLKIYGAGNIYFGNKELIKDGIIMVGDAAKVIAPLAGDGIAMAFQSAQIASGIIIDYSHGKVNSSEIEHIYETEWKEHFKKRTTAALLIQKMIMQDRLMKIIPGMAIQGLMPAIIAATRN